MRALVFDGALRLAPDHPEPSRQPGEALVRVRAAGVCRTDLEIARGYLDHRGVLGHEFVGEVAAAADPAWIGARVCGDINAACGRCPACARGEGHHCPQRTVLGIVGRGGCFADYLALPLANLVRVPDAVSDEEAVFAEPLAAAFRILEQVPLAASDRALVLGDGRLGILVARVLALVSEEVTLVGKHAAKLARAASARVATALLDRASDLRGADLVVDATGRPEGLAIALDLVRPRGTVVLKTTVAARSSVELAPAVVHEVQILGSRCGPMDRAVRALAAREIPVLDLIADRFPLSEGLLAMARAAQPGVLKVLLSMLPPEVAGP